MNKRRDKLIEFLLHPPKWLCIAIWVFGVVTLAGSITLYYIGVGLEIWAVSVHVIAFVFVLLSIYAVLTLIGIPERAKDKPKVQKFFSSYSVRAFVYALCSVVFNICYVVFGVIIANVNRSPWLGVLVGYHVFLILPRFEVLWVTKVRGKGASGRNAEINQTRAYANCGLLLVMLAVALIPVINMVFNDMNNYRHFTSAIVYVVAIAAYTFTKLGISIYNFRRVHKQDDLSLIAVKNVSLTDALISVFMLQAMMLKELPGGENSISLMTTMNPIMGMAIVAAIFSLGVYMIVNGHKRLKALETQNMSNAGDTQADGGSDVETDEI